MKGQSKYQNIATRRTGIYLSKKALKTLRNELPAGSFEIIRKRLLNDGQKFSFSYINMVLDPNDPRMNTIILDEAIAYRDELIAKKQDRESRILNK